MLAREKEGTEKKLNQVEKAFIRHDKN